VYPIPQHTGDAAGVLELYRLAVPLPTVMPSYNQIGFDSLHYLVGMVEGSEDGKHAIGWIVGAKLAADESATVHDPETKVQFPVEIDLRSGLIKLTNEEGFTVNAMNFDVPFKKFLVSARLDDQGKSVEAPGVFVTTKCGDIPTYGAFLVGLGFCNQETDMMSVYGSILIRPHHSGSQTAPAGTGQVTFTLKKPSTTSRGTVTASFQDSLLKAKEHSYSVLLVDATTGRPMPQQYGLNTSVKAAANGTVKTVTLTLGPKTVLPAKIRCYLMVDTYPASSQTL
jgi:hypothetical protein